MGGTFASRLTESGTAVRLPVALIVGAGIFVSALAAQTMHGFEQRRTQAAFELAAEQAIDAVEDRINQHIQLTQSIVSLFHSSSNVDRDEFATFVAPALKRYPAIQAVGWAPRVSHSRRESFEAAARSDGFANFAFNERTTDGRWAPAGIRDEYFPTFYMEPRPSNEQTLGFDYRSSPVRRAAMERARDTGDSALTAPVRLTLISEPSNAVLVFTPIYAGAAVPETVESRQRDLTGYAYAQIRPPRIVEALNRVTPSSRLGAAVRLDVFDITDAPEATYLFSYAPGVLGALSDSAPTPEIKTNDFVRVVEFGGRQWTVIARASQTAVAYGWQAWGAMGAVLVLTALLAAYLQATLNRQRAIENEVGLRTIELELTNRLLQGSEDRIRNITNSVPGLIAYLDRDLIYRFANDRYREVGLDPAKMIGKSVREVRGATAAYEQIAPHFERAAAGEKVAFEIEISVGSQQRWRQIECLPDFADDGTVKGFYAMSHDITALKTVDRMKDEFVSTVSHELRTPLTSIKGALGIVRAKTRGTLAPEMAQMLDIAYKNCDRLMLLINDILDIEKIEAGKMEFRMALLDLVPLVSAAITANQSYADQFGVKIMLADAPEQAWVSGDEGRLMQVLANLMSNAAKFSPPNGSVEIAIERRQGSFRVSVSDHGPGIPEAQRDRMFQKFSQVDGSDRRKVGGTGLGLSIVRAIVEHHGGAADYVSEVGKGTTFFIDLPEARPEARAEAAAQ